MRVDGSRTAMGAMVPWSDGGDAIVGERLKARKSERVGVTA
jgi:hypothetical protein